MTVYTVHEPPTPTAATDPERFRFVRDGFYLWAFLLTPLWLLWHRLWLVFTLYAGGMAVLFGALWALGASPGVRLLVLALVSLLIGMEAGSLKRWTLRRRGWNDLGVVVATDLESAERRFFDTWVGRETARPLVPIPPVPNPVRMTRTERGDRPLPRAGRATVSVAVVDYGSGNLHSVAKAFERAAGESKHQPIMVTRDPEVVRRADRVVLPGVGAFADCRRGLDAVSGMVAALEETVRRRGRPFLGICVGMQLMTERGREYEVTEGLGWIPGEVDKLAPSDHSLKIPHMGWNTLNPVKPHPLLAGIPLGAQGLHAYFVHSYNLNVAERADLVAEADYGGPVTAVVARDSYAGHPVPSGEEPAARSRCDRQFSRLEALDSFKGRIFYGEPVSTSPVNPPCSERAVVILFPAIDLKDGLCVRLEQGDMARATIFNRDAAAQAHAFEVQGFEYLHLVDLDGAFAGKPVNASAVDRILETVSIPVQLGGGIRDTATVEAWLDKGVTRVIIGTAAVRDPPFVRQAARDYPGRVVVGLDARAGRVAVEGWAQTADVSALDIARRFEDVGVAAIIYTDVARDGMLTGLNLDATIALAEAVRIPVDRLGRACLARRCAGAARAARAQARRRDRRPRAL